MRSSVAVAVVMLCPAILCGQDELRLRQAARLPTLSSFGSIGFNSSRIFHLAGETPNYRGYLAYYQKELRGNLEDAETYLQIGRCHYQLEDAKRAVPALEKARELFEQQLQADAKNVAALRGLGETLALFDKNDEAEAKFRAAIAAAPRDWLCRISLGRFYDDLAYATLVGSVAGKQGLELGKLLALALKQEAQEATFARVRTLTEAARTCFDQAVELAPNQAGAYIERGMSRTLQGCLLGSLKVLEGERDVNPLEGMYAPEVLADFKQAARLDPDNFRLVGYAAMLAVTAAQADGNPDTAKIAPIVREALAALDKPARSQQPATAAGATEVMAFLQIFALQQTEPAAQNYRRVLALDPGRDNAWEMLAACLANAGKFDDMVAVCRRRVELRDSPRARLCMAKAYEAIDQLDKAELEVRAALKQNADDVLANLSLSVLLVKNRRDAAALTTAAAHLDMVEKKLTRTSPEMADYCLTRGIQRGLQGDRPGARQLIEDVLRNDPSNDRAKLALTALGRDTR